MLSLIALAVVQPQDNPVARFDQFMSSAKSISVDLELSMSSTKEVGKGTLIIRRPDHLLFKMKWGPSNYSFSIMPDYVVTIEHGNKVYREYGPVGRFFVPDPDISRTPEYGLPIALLAGSLNAMMPDGYSMRPGEKSTHEGSTVDTATGRYSTQTAQVTITAKVDSAGRLVNAETVYAGGPNRLTINLKVSNYRINPELKDSEFATPLPSGYVPESLPPGSYPINFGEKFDFAGWSPLGDAGSLRDLTQGKPLFLAISDSDCEVSQRSTRMVDQLANQLRSKGVACAAITLDANAGQTPVFRTLPNYYDPNGKASDRLRVPGTPMFLFVDAKGIVQRVWLGYDNAKVNEFTADVVGWATGERE